ncbi:MAG: hypothetical protein JXJ19_03190 [Elusimicrobia bacterium]|nr:hypothetical protein [Elusimicrobiota bacterium]
MAYKQIGSPDPKYLAMTDILIGDMSDTNYEYIIFNRPIVLLANKWLRENFPDIGIKTDLPGLERAIEKSIAEPDEFAQARKKWLNATISNPRGNNSGSVLDKILEYSGLDNPYFVFIHGGDKVKQTNLKPLEEEAKKRKYSTEFVSEIKGDFKKAENLIFIAAHFKGLAHVEKGYKVHLDHGLKGKGTANVEYSMKDYMEHDYFPMIDLHITAGKIGQERTRMLLGPMKERAIIAGYPKADDLLRLNTAENRKQVCAELGFDCSRPVITYAPAGEESYIKPGGSLTKEVLTELKHLERKTKYNILIKLKYPEATFNKKIFRKLKKLISAV